jgi:hypothetical protein
MALAEMIEDLKKKTEDAKKRVEGAAALLKDNNKIAAARLHEGRKMDDFVNGISAALGRAKEERDKILVSKDYKAITNAKDPLKVKFLAQNEILTKKVQVEFGKLRESAGKIAAAVKAGDPRKKALQAKLNEISQITTSGQAHAKKEIWKDLAAFAKTEHSDENFRFVEAIEGGKLDAAGKMVTDGDINLPASSADAIKKTPNDAGLYKEAFVQIMRLITNDTLKRWRTTRMKGIEAEIAKLAPY